MPERSRDRVPLVTVAIPTIDRPGLLRRALASVLGQTDVAFEVIVSDNASVMDVRAVVHDAGDERVRYQRHPSRLPMSANWNSCLEAARGTYFVLLSDDDALGPRSLSTLVSRFRQGGGVAAEVPAFVYGRSLVVDAADHPLWTSARGAADESAVEFYRGLLSHRRAIYPCSTMLKTADLRHVGGYDGQRFGSASDLAAALKLALAGGNIVYADRVVSRYTEHSGNLTTQQDVTRWVENMQAIHRLVETALGPSATGISDLRSRSEQFTAYFVMDVIVRREVRAGAGPLAAWKIADRTRQAAGLSTSAKPRLRALAKAIYLRARSVRRLR